MNGTLRGAAAVAAALVLLLTASAAAYSEAVVLFTFQDERITESSGLVASSVSDDWFFTHNDSGDDARFYAVDRGGRTLATHTMPGVDADDWEDLARGPDEQGRSSLYLGDIGDNAMLREQVVVYRVPEPAVDATRTGVELETPAPDTFVLQYEDVAHDAETLLVHPVTGQLFVVTKTYVGQASLYASPVPLRSDRPNVLTRVADLVFTPTGTPGGDQFGPGANLATTGGDISPSGDRVAVRTYTDLYEWSVDGTDVAAALQPTRPRQRTALPATVQGEAAAYTRDGRSVVVSTEGEGAPVHLLADEAPPSAPATRPPSSQPAPASSPAGTPAAPSGAGAGSGTGAGAAGQRLPSTGLPDAGWGGLLLVAAALAVRRLRLGRDPSGR